MPSSPTAIEVAETLQQQIERDRAEWEALSPTVRKALENELAAIWPNFPCRILENRHDG